MNQRYVELEDNSVEEVHLYCVVAHDGKQTYVAATSYGAAVQKYMAKIGDNAAQPVKVALSAQSENFIL